MDPLLPLPNKLTPGESEGNKEEDKFQLLDPRQKTNVAAIEAYPARILLNKITQNSNDCEVFYEARPVKSKIRLIASTFYPSFPLSAESALISWSHSTYATTPILCGELYAHYADRAVALTIITNFKLQNQPSSRCFPGGEKKSFIAPSHRNIQYAFVFLAPGRAVSQHRPATYE